MKSLVIFAIFVRSALGDSEANSTNEALQKTLKTLKSPTERAAAIQNDPNAKKTDAHVTEITGTEENKEALYDLSAQIMETITQRAKGDPDKMVELLEEAQRNPAAFAESFTPAQKKALKELSKKLEKSGAIKHNP